MMFSAVNDVTLMQDRFRKNLFCAAIMVLPIDDDRTNMTVLGEVLYRAQLPLLILCEVGFDHEQLSFFNIPKVIIQGNDEGKK
jgi:hypothetical protein